MATITGTSNDDNLQGTPDADVISGLDGNDIIDGAGGNDTVSGGEGMDELSGGDGDDVVMAAENSDSLGYTLLDGGAGTDWLELSVRFYTGPVTLDLNDTTGPVRNFEQTIFRGAIGINTIYGGNLLDIIWGGASADHLEGRGGDDDLRGFGGNDVLLGGAGNDLLIGGDGADQLFGGDDDDNLHAGTEGSYLDGGAGNDGLSGSLGDDTLVGGTGDDSYVVNNVGDVVTENAGEGTDGVQTSLATYSLVGTNVENLFAANAVAHDFRGNAGANLIIGGNGNDLLRLNDGGNDTVRGQNGNDVLYFGAAFTGADVAQGGAGRDVLVLQGNYNLTLSSTNLFSMESISLQGGFNDRWGDTANNFYDYDIKMADANVPAGVQLIVNGQSLRVGEDFTFDGSAETNGRYLVYGGSGVDTLTGGAGADVFFFEGLRFQPGDRVDGGAGRDSIIISSGTGLNQFHFSDSSFTNIEAISVNNRFTTDPTQNPSYELVLANGNVAAGATLILNGSSITNPDQTVTFDGSAIEDGALILFAGAGDDILIGGDGADLLYAAGGTDELTGGGGADTFQYRAASDSTVANPDSILDFETGVDKIDLRFIDADSHVAGDQAFTFIGSDAFSGSAGELRAFESEGSWFVEGDMNGDGAADLAISVTTQGAALLGPGDFLF